MKQHSHLISEERMWHFKYFRTQTNTSPPETHTHSRRQSRMRMRMRKRRDRCRWWDRRRCLPYFWSESLVSGCLCPGAQFSSALDFWQLHSCNEFVEEFANEVRPVFRIKCNLILNCIKRKLLRTRICS